MAQRFLVNVAKRLLIGAAVVVTVVLALLVTVLSPERFRGDVERRLAEGFGRPAHIDTLRYTIVRGIGIEATGVVIDEDPSFGDGPLLTVDSVWADLGVWNAMTGRGSIIEELVFDKPSVTLIKREDGVWNWATLGSGVARPGPASAVAATESPAIAMAGISPAIGMRVTTPERVVINDAVVATIDETAEPGAVYSYRALSLDTSVAREAGGYHVTGRLSGDSTSAGGEPLALDAQFDVELTPPGPAPAWGASGHVPSGRIATRNLKLDRLSTGITLVAGSALRLDGLEASLYGGTLAADATIDVGTSGNRFDAVARLDGVSIGDALAYRSDVGGSLGGRLTATFRGTGRLGHINTTLGSLTGDGHLDIADASLNSVGVLENLAERGGFAAGPLGGDRTMARRVSADYTVLSGRATLDGASISGLGDCADISAKRASISLATPPALSIEGSLTLYPQFFSSLADANPGSATVLRAISVLPQIRVPVAVDGPLTDPAVRVRWPGT